MLRHEHRAGEKLFVDYAGDTILVHDPATGEVRAAAIFVAVLGASSYTYAEATWTQNLADWIGAHLRAFEFMGGTPEILAPDNLNVPLHLNGPGVIQVAGERVAVLICYEQLLVYPVLASMLQRPTILVGISNTFWFSDTPIPRYQVNAVRSWAKLFRLPYLTATNS